VSTSARLRPRARRGCAGRRGSPATHSAGPQAETLTPLTGSRNADRLRLPWRPFSLPARQAVFASTARKRRSPDDSPPHQPRSLLPSFPITLHTDTQDHEILETLRLIPFAPFDVIDLLYCLLSTLHSYSPAIQPLPPLCWASPDRQHGHILAAAVFLSSDIAPSPPDGHDPNTISAWVRML